MLRLMNPFLVIMLDNEFYAITLISKKDEVDEDASPMKIVKHF